MGRSAFISRREGRYVFRARRPVCLLQPGGPPSSFRISLHTANYTVAVRRAAKIASWMLRMKSATNLQEALLELAPRVRELAVQPVMGGDDLVERTALSAAFFARTHVNDTPF